MRLPLSGIFSETTDVLEALGAPLNSSETIDIPGPFSQGETSIGKPDTVLMVAAAGVGRPGVTARLIGVSAAHRVNLLDIRQTSFHNRFRQSFVPDPINAGTTSARGLNIGLDQTVAVDDGDNDALMLGQGGLGIAYNPNKGLERVANAALGKRHMIHILYLSGITQEDRSEACSCKSENAPAGVTT